MSNITSYVVDVLAGSSLLSAYVGDRVYKVPAPQSVIRPYVTVFLVDEVYQNTLEGSSGLSRCRVQIDIYAARQVDASDIADAVRDTFFVEGDFARRPLVVSRREMFESSTNVHRVSVDVILWHVFNATSP